MNEFKPTRAECARIRELALRCEINSERVFESGSSVARDRAEQASEVAFLIAANVAQRSVHVVSV